MLILQQIFDCDWSPKRAPPLEKIFTICKKIVAWLKMDKRNVVAIQCQVSLFSNSFVPTTPVPFYNVFFFSMPKVHLKM
jgi:hypothetical protein